MDKPLYKPKGVYLISPCAIRCAHFSNVKFGYFRLFLLPLLNSSLFFVIFSSLRKHFFFLCENFPVYTQTLCICRCVIVPVLMQRFCFSSVPYNSLLSVTTHSILSCHGIVLCESYCVAFGFTVFLLEGFCALRHLINLIVLFHESICKKEKNRKYRSNETKTPQN